MEMEKDKIKDLFSSKLGSFEPEVPASVWGGLDQLLSNQPSPTVDPASSNSSAANAASSAGNASIVKTVAIIVGLAAAVTTGIIFIPGDKNELVVEDSKNIMTEEVKTPFVEPDSTDTILLPVEPLIAKVDIPAKKEGAVSFVDKVVVSTPETSVIKEETPVQKEPETKSFVEKESPVVEELPLIPEVKSSSKGFSIGVKADANLFADNTTQRGGNLLFSRADRSTTFTQILKVENSEFELEHKQPVSFGVTVSKQIIPRLSLETGLVYTRLSSKVKSNSVFNIDETQTFDYLGVPLSLNYTLYELGKAKFYISAGGMIQKDISGKYISNMDYSISALDGNVLADDIFYTEPYYIKRKIKQSNPQFSIYTTLGVSYPIYRKLYLYGTIGGVYYFDAGNRYRTIYSDKKTQLNLNLGVKFDF